MVGGRGLRAAVAVMLIGGAAGCTDPDRAILALAAPGGRPTAVLVSCGGFTSISVYPDEASHSFSPGGASWRVTMDRTDPGVIEIPLLGEAPTGWRGSGPTDARLEPGIRYGLGGSAGEAAMPLKFTTDDVARIPAGQVLVPDGRQRSKLVARSRFESEARDACR
jgi:hypothetical protein